MNVRKHLTIGLALVGLALGLTTVQANAQPVLKGTFELPAAAYWGNTLLQPGQYSIWMSTEMRDLAHVPAIHLSGEGINLTFLAIAKPDKESGRNYLDVANIDGTYVIRAFDAGLIGESFAFGVTKNVKSKALRASAELPGIAVPVAAE
ncbi:MAG: hypothetical protein ABSG56_12000 [Bryobacteraceae bacterium]|jgi:hypothetical protein